MNEPEPVVRASSAYRGLILIGLGVVALLVVAGIVVVVAGDRGEPAFEAGSPEAALHDYLAAYEAGQLDAAHAQFSTRVRDRWDIDAYRDAVDGGEAPGAGAARRVIFEGADVTGEAARVRLTIEEFVGDGLGGDTIRDSREIRMVREDGAWRIDEALVWLDPFRIPLD
ncbi:MAG: hypothetical protein K5924_06255 [Chloroflexi bacterium]|nr:hypothetical protein [Chloroflexota bacterium]